MKERVIMLEKIKKVVSRHLDVEQDDINLDSNFQRDFGAQPLDLLQVVMELEEEFDVQLDDDEAYEITTVQDMINKFQKAM